MTCEETLNAIEVAVNKIGSNDSNESIYSLDYSGGVPVLVTTFNTDGMDLFNMFRILSITNLRSHVELYKKIDLLHSDLADIKTFLGINS